MPKKKNVTEIKSLTNMRKVFKKIMENPDAFLGKGPTFNEYGVCIECQGGDPSCHHNNLVQDNTGTHCALCGLKVV